MSARRWSWIQDTHGLDGRMTKIFIGILAEKLADFSFEAEIFVLA